MVWGIGYGIWHKEAMDPSCYPPNSNLLGKILMRVRDRLRWQH